LTHKSDKYGRNCKCQFAVPIVPLNIHLPISPILDDTTNNNVGIATSAIQFIVFAVSIEKIDQSRMAAMDTSGIHYVPQYVLTQDQVDDRGRGALAMIDKLTGFNNRSLCELSPSSHNSLLAQPGASNSSGTALPDGGGIAQCRRTSRKRRHGAP